MESFRTRRGRLNAALAFALFVALYVALYYFPVTYNDWWTFFRPAARSPADPYQVPGILNPPWTFVLLYPLGQLPGRWGGAAIAFLTILALALYLRSPRRTPAVALSAPFVFVIVLAQLDGLVLYGLLVPTWIGSLFILIKPQGALFTLLNRISIRSALVLAAVLGLSLLLWGLWPQKILRMGAVPDPVRNASFFPYSLSLAPLLLYLGCKRRSDALLCWATLCAVPFFQIHSLLATAGSSARELKDWRMTYLLPLATWLWYGLYVGWVV